MTDKNVKLMKYLGPVSTLAPGKMEGDKFKVAQKGKGTPLITGQVYPDKKAKLPALPVDHPTVKSLIARKMLVEVAPSETAVTDSTTDGNDGDQSSDPSKTQSEKTK